MVIRFLFLACTLLSQVAAFCQISTQPVTPSGLPNNIQYKGEPAAAVRFSDATGSYLLLTTQTGVLEKGGSSDNRSAHLYAYAYQLAQDSTAPQLVWQMNDGVDECLLDVMASFVLNAPRITDLDKNGRAEIWLVYRTACRGDVSPAEMKIIMHEGNRKYAMRGEGKIQTGNTPQPDGGSYNFDETFQKGNAAFRQYAAALWKQNEVEMMK